MIRDNFRKSIYLDKIIYVALINILFDISMYISLVVYASFIIAITSFISLFSGLIPHILVKKFGDNRIMIFSFFSLCCLYLILSIARARWSFFIVSCFIGIV